MSVTCVEGAALIPTRLDLLCRVVNGPNFDCNDFPWLSACWSDSLDLQHLSFADGGDGVVSLALPSGTLQWVRGTWQCLRRIRMIIETVQARRTRCAMARMEKQNASGLERKGCVKTHRGGGLTVPGGVVSVTTTGARLPLCPLAVSLMSTARLLAVRDGLRSCACLVSSLGGRFGCLDVTRDAVVVYGSGPPPPGNYQVF